jgi:hypothetical protein
MAELVSAQARLAAPRIVYVDSALTVAFEADPNVWYVVDTAAHPVTATMPVGVGIGHWVIISNAPVGGAQQGGTARGNSVTVCAGPGETMEGRPSETIGPPTGLTTAACRPYHPTGSAAASSGFGPGWMHV